MVKDHDIGGSIQAARDARGLTRAELAKLVGVTHVAVWLWERGKRRPNLESGAELSRVLGLDWQKIIRK